MFAWTLFCSILISLLTTTPAVQGQYGDAHVLLLFRSLDCHEYAVAQQLIKDNPGITNTYNQYGCTALCRAAAIGDVKAVEVLLTDPSINVNAWCSKNCVYITDNLDCDNKKKEI